MKDYLTVVEFAAAGITKQAVYKRIKQDLAPYVKSKTEKRLYQNTVKYVCPIFAYCKGCIQN